MPKIVRASYQGADDIAAHKSYTEVFGKCPAEVRVAIDKRTDIIMTEPVFLSIDGIYRKLCPDGAHDWETKEFKLDEFLNPMDLDVWGVDG